MQINIEEYNSLKARIQDFNLKVDQIDQKKKEIQYQMNALLSTVGMSSEEELTNELTMLANLLPDMYNTLSKNLEDGLSKIKDLSL